ncbi:MAG: hypothetical protein EAZ91_02740 [Cytophagales bacterium]|nr:MAG: hypothetical protein EAZ91_02740 [Cytophagales bacterium]
MKSYSEAVTESSLRASISVGLRQLAQAIDHNEAELFLSHSAPAQSACEQVSTWLKSHATTYDGRVIDLSWFRHLLAEELDTLRYMIGEKAFWSGNYSDAGRLFNELATRMTR